MELLLMEKGDKDISLLLERVKEGDDEAFSILYNLLYKDLKVRANRLRENWHGNHTLNATALVHEAYEKIFENREKRWDNRAHFMSVAAQAMRQVIINYAESHRTLKRGGEYQKIALDQLFDQLKSATLPDPDILIDIDTILKKLEKSNPLYGRIVECRFFIMMTTEETAEALGISPSTVKRTWKFIKTLLYRELVQDERSVNSH